MKKAVVLVAHPYLNERSIGNKIIVEALKKMDNVDVRDLYALYPDFKIDEKAEQAALLDADLIVFQFPFYWYSTPSILKEWQDIVLSYGFAFGSTGDKLKGKDFLISSTIGGAYNSYSRDNYNTFSTEELFRPLEQTSNLTGMIFNPPIVTHGMIFIPGVYGEVKNIQKLGHEHADRVTEYIQKKLSD